MTARSKPEGIIEDFQTVQTVLEGDREAFADLVRAHHPRVISLCLSILLNKAEADDAAQDVFLKAFKSLHRYTRNVSFRAWLCRIASNHCIDVLRKRKRQKTDSLDGLMDQLGDPFESSALGTPDPNESPSDHSSKVELALRALASLPVEQRQILVLRELEELSYDEIGSALDCSLDAVKARLRRAREKLLDVARHFPGECSFK